jgi:hypothetical protein
MGMCKTLFFSPPSLFARACFQKLSTSLSVSGLKKTARLFFFFFFFFSFFFGRKTRESRTVRDFSFAAEQRAAALCFSAHLGWSPHRRDHPTIYDYALGFNIFMNWI